MNKTRHLAISIALSLLILVTGTAGYMIIEDWRFLDALYMTIITISTVGYREVNQIGDIGRVFTIFLVLIGVGFTFYVMAAVVQFMVEGRVRIIMGRRRLDKQIDRITFFWFYRPGSWPRNLTLLHGPVRKGPRTNCARPAPIR
jgi:voltage-gated potassium channel